MIIFINEKLFNKDHSTRQDEIRKLYKFNFESRGDYPESLKDQQSFL